MADVRIDLIADAGAARKARDVLRTAISDLPDGFQQDASLLVSELVTNSVLHASSAPGSQIGLRIAVDEDLLRVDISDDSPTIAAKKPPGERSYGLTVVEMIATGWGAERREGVNVTWFEMRLPTP
jgi:anti-sigma regulatory factor (Ser/Thr protein kinase)